MIGALAARPVKDEGIVRSLRAKLDAGQGDRALRAAAAEALGRTGALGAEGFDKETATALANAMLRDPDAGVRGSAASALGCFGAAGRCADFALKRALETESSSAVRARVETARRRLWGEPEEAPVVIPEGALDSGWRPVPQRREPIRFDAPPAGRERTILR